MLTKEQMLSIFEETGGILSGHFLLTSGRNSDKYMQCARLFTSAEHSEKICAELAKLLRQYNAEIVVTPAIGGIILGYELSRQLKIRNIFAERTEGKMEFRRGFELKPKARVIVAEDVVTTGGSVKEVINLVKDLGGEVAAVASIVDRSNGKVEFGHPFVSLLSMEVLSYEKEECPICKKGVPLIKPGSRNLQVK